jgi:hypothetical protein
VTATKNTVARAEQARVDAMLADVDEFDDLDAAYAEIRRKPYGFVWAGQKWVLPHIGGLDWRTQAKIEEMDALGIDAIFALFAEMFGDAQAERWKQTVQPSDALPLLFERWLAHSKVKQGEDEASNDSSENTGEKSRPTSAPSTASASPKRSTARKPAKRAPRKAATKPPTAAELATQVDEEWLAKHQTLAGSPPGRSST